VSKEEEAFPFALATLRVYSLQDGDGGKRDGGATAAAAVAGAAAHDTGGVSVNNQEWFGSGFDSDEPISFQSALRRARVAVFEVDSVSRGAIRFNVRDQPFKVLQELGSGFFNVRVPFIVYGTADIGTHMSMARLKNGRFLVLGTVDPNGEAY
jgi:hypothetical protein